MSAQSLIVPSMILFILVLSFVVEKKSSGIEILPSEYEIVSNEKRLYCPVMDTSSLFRTDGKIIRKEYDEFVEKCLEIRKKNIMYAVKS